MGVMPVRDTGFHPKGCHPSVSYFHDIVYYVPYCNVRTVVE
ncbi:hypothetical protein [Wolbachia sp. wLmal]